MLNVEEKKGILKPALISGAVVFTAAILFFELFRVASPPSIDLLQYWSAAQLFLTHQNPYDEQLVKVIELSVGATDGVVLMWNPPFILPLIVPFTLLSYDVLKLVWCCFSMAAFAGCLVALFSLYQKYLKEWHSRLPLWILLILFTPFFENLALGQISILLLIGVCGWWICFSFNQFRSFTAGSLLGLTLIKPHLLIPLYLVLGIFSFQRREWRLLTGFVAAALALSLAALAFEPAIFYWYFSAMKSPPIYWRTPNLGSFLQAITQIHTVWIRFTPLLIALAIIGSVMPRLGRRADIRHIISMLTFLLPLSLMVSPYGWIYDQLLMLPILFQIVLVQWKRASMTALQRRIQFALLLFGQLGLVLLPAAWGQERGIVSLVSYTVVALSNLYFESRDRSLILPS